MTYNAMHSVMRKNADLETEIERLRGEIADEREACAQFIEQNFSGAQPIADAIRKRKP